MIRCMICKELIGEEPILPFGRGQAHLECYTPDKQRDYDVIETRKSHSGESSPYWQWVTETAKFGGWHGDNDELPEANPDVLPGDEAYQDRREVYRGLIEATVTTLSPREKQVFFGLKNGLTEADIAENIGVSRSMVEKCRRNLKKKFQREGIKTAS